MEAEIESPFTRKYYGTIISTPHGEIAVWLDGDDPSAAQLADWGMTLEEAVANDMICDTHYQSQRDYDVAHAILAALRALP